MDIRVLRYFLVVANELNITRAANLLYITQPTLSRQLNQLEKDLNVQLFIRIKNGVTLKDEGIYLKRYAEEIINLTERVKLNITSTQKSLEGVLYIGIAECKATRELLPNYLRVFRDKFPKVNVSIMTLVADQVKDHIDKGIMDAAVVLEPADMGIYDQYILPIKENWGIMLRKDDPLSKEEVIHKEHLIGEDIILPQRLELQMLFANWMEDSEDSSSIEGFYNTINSAGILVRNNIGKAFTIDGSFLTLPEDLCFRPCTPPLLTHSVIIWRKGKTSNRILEEFLNVVREY